MGSPNEGFNMLKKLKTDAKNLADRTFNPVSLIVWHPEAAVHHTSHEYPSRHTSLKVGKSEVPASAQQVGEGNKNEFYVVADCGSKGYYIQLANHDKQTLVKFPAQTSYPWLGSS